MKGLKAFELLLLYLAVIVVVWIVVSSIVDAASASKDVAEGIGTGAEVFEILGGMGVLALLVL